MNGTITTNVTRPVRALRPAEPAILAGLVTAQPLAAEQIRFLGEDIFQKLDKQKKQRQEAELAQKVPQALGETYFTAKGTAIKGVDFLKLIQDNKPGWFSWLSNGDLSVFDLARRVAEHVDVRSMKSGENANQMVARQMARLEELGCLKCTRFSSNPTERRYRLTGRGKAILKQYQETGKISYVKVQTFLGFNFSSNEFGMNDSRINQIQVTLTQNRLGHSGWDVMQKIKKLSEPLITPFSAFERNVSFERLAQELGFLQTGDKSFLTQIKQLQEAGLLEINKPWLESEPRLYLTPRAKTLLQKDSPHRAFQINDEDISAMVDDTLANIDTQKAARKEHLGKVQAEQKLLEERLEGKRIALAAKQGELNQKQSRAKTLSDMELVEIRAEMGLLERQIKLYGDRLEDVKQQVKLASQLYAQWLDFIAKKVEKLGDAKVKLSISQNNRLLNDFLNNLKQLGAAKGMMDLGDQNNQTLEELVEENLVYSQVAVDQNLEDWESKNGLSLDTAEYLRQLELLAKNEEAGLGGQNVSPEQDGKRSNTGNKR